MQLQNCIKKLLEYLDKLEQPKYFSVAVMPDFFLDRIISLNQNVKEFSKEISKIVARKGGSIDKVLQMDLRGGNAANTASALAALGADVYPILETSKLGLETLKFYFKHLKIDTSHVKFQGEASITTALEFIMKKSKANVMLRNLGSLEKFSSEKLTKEDFKLLKKVDYVCVFNWAGTRLHGTELAEQVFSYVKKEGKGKTYYDTADPTPNKKRIPELIERVLSKNIVDMLSVNEAEAAIYAKYFTSKHSKTSSYQTKIENSLQNARILAENFHTRIDIHTSKFAASVTENSETVVPTFNVPVLKVTGAGDAWNAGNIYGYAQNFPEDSRLTFANAVAAYYISNSSYGHPTLNQLVKFCEKQLTSFKH
jgi:sugar/nucleoside kinase (ribokinase family)